MRVYWEDTDAGGIVFYANYLKFFERARTEWLRSLGLVQSTLKANTGGMFVVADTSVRYLRPARLDDELIVTAQLAEKGRASLIIMQTALLKPEQTSLLSNLPSTLPSTFPTTVLAQGTIRIGWVNAATLQPARIPSAVLDRLVTLNKHT